MSLFSFVFCATPGTVSVLSDPRSNTQPSLVRTKMANKREDGTIEALEHANDSINSYEPDRPQELSKQRTKVNEHGVALVPQPSDDPRDPLVRCRILFCWDNC